MKVLEGLFYSKDHEWVKVEGTKAFVGITDYAQNALGNIVFVDLPAVGAQIAAGEALGVVESVKAASDIYSPISGEVVEINEALLDNPELLNESAFDAWIAAIELSDTSEIEGLLSFVEYEEFCSKEG